jgi:hypothetical protein
VTFFTLPVIVADQPSALGEVNARMPVRLTAPVTPEYYVVRVDATISEV